jgi:hypothetical protein
MMAVSLAFDSSANRWKIGPPVRLFTAHPGGATRQGLTRHYNVSGNDQRFLIHTLREATLPITVVLNWNPAP